MKIIKILFILISSFHLYSQSEWTKKQNGLLNYAYPNNWTESELLETSTNLSYGAVFFDLGETVELSIMEIPNDTGINDAHTISADDIKNLVLKIFSPNTTFNEIKNASIANTNSKYVNGYAITSQNLKVETKLHLIFIKNKMIIIQVNSTSKKGDRYIELSEKIFNKINQI